LEDSRTQEEQRDFKRADAIFDVARQLCAITS